MRILLAESEEPSSEAQLWHRWRVDRDVTAREELIEHYLPFAKSVAARLFRGRGDESVVFDDYVQYARMGLIEAVDRYDPGRGAVFKTFAIQRVRGSILNGLDRETERAAYYRYRASKVQERVESLESGRKEGQAEVLRGLVGLTVALAFSFLLDVEEEPLADESVEANPYASTELTELRSRLSKAVSELPERERWIVQQHYVNGCEFQDIAAALQLTKGRVSQLHARAIGMIRQRISGQEINNRL